jgi:N-acetylglucosaminyl-diphospho-decaprenol L-rhamnosyltransferase
MPADAEVIVVDNAAEPHIAELCETFGAQYVESPVNVGFGAACNLGAKQATRTFLMFLNPDCRLEEGAAQTLLSHAESAPDCILGPSFTDGSGLPRFQVRRFSNVLRDASDLLPGMRRWVPSSARRDLPPNDPVYQYGGEVEYLQGACLLVSRQLFCDVGGFDPDFFLYFEEESLCTRVVRHGGRALYEPQATVSHIGNTSTRKVKAISTQHYFRSLAVLYRKRHSGAAYPRLLLLALALTLRIPARAIRRDLAYPLQPAFRGLLEGSTTRLQKNSL